MALVDLNIADDDSLVSSDSDISQAPCLYLTAAQVKALGITEPPRAGTTMTMQAQVMVESATESVDGDMDDPDIMLRLLVTHASLGAAAKSTDGAGVMYGS